MLLPQQRLLVERGYEALHTAGLDRAAVGGSLTGVYVGIAANEFGAVLAASPAGGSVYAATGSALSVASGRLSYVLGLHGACAAYDSACSAALVAFHAAVRSLQGGECDKNPRYMCVQCKQDCPPEKYDVCRTPTKE